MSAEDYISDSLGSDLEPDPTDDQEKEPWVPPSCKYCGRPGLRWIQDRKGRWSLRTENGTKHVCKEFTTGFAKVGKTEKVK